MLVFLEGRYQFFFSAAAAAAALHYAPGSLTLTSLITQSSHFRWGYLSHCFFVGLFFLMVLIVDTCFLHACPAHFSLVNEICFLVLVCWKRSWSFWLCFFLHSPVWWSLYCLKNLYKIFLLKKPSHILLFFFFFFWEAMFLS